SRSQNRATSYHGGPWSRPSTLAAYGGSTTSSSCRFSSSRERAEAMRSEDSQPSIRRARACRVPRSTARSHGSASGASFESLSSRWRAATPLGAAMAGRGLEESRDRRGVGLRPLRQKGRSSPGQVSDGGRRRDRTVKDLGV